MNMKSMIAAAVVVASTVASAATFQWTVTLDNGADWDTIWINHYDSTGNSVKNKWGSDGASYSKGTSVMEFTFDKVDADGKAYLKDKDGNINEVTYLKFGVYNGDTYIGNTTSDGYKWNSDSKCLSWADIYKAIQNGGTFTTDVNFNPENPWTTSKVGTMTFAVPEPTSGLMLLLGAGMLALRRKAVRA